MYVNPVQNYTTNADNDIIEKFDGTPYRYPFTIRYFRSTGTIRFSRFDGVRLPQIDSVRSINDGLIHHIAAVKDGSMLYLYIDGIIDGSITDNTSTTTMNGTPIGIAVRPAASPYNYFTGIVDELSIWNRGLSTEDIRNIISQRL
ncbi:MAG: hypothetical protein OMM_15199, partial [Candidatus Magnetoglobus multicellularis str. Araruama]